MTVQTQSVHFTADQKLLEYVEQQLKSLERYFGRIVKASVTLRLENAGSSEQRITEIRLNIPGSIVFVREQSKSFEMALTKAISALKRQLMRYKRKVTR